MSPYLMTYASNKNSSSADDPDAPPGSRACFKFIAIGCWASGGKGCCVEIARKLRRLEILASAWLAGYQQAGRPGSPCTQPLSLQTRRAHPPTAATLTPPTPQTPPAFPWRAGPGCARSVKAVTLNGQALDPSDWRYEAGEEAAAGPEAGPKLVVRGLADAGLDFFTIGADARVVFV